MASAQCVLGCDPAHAGAVLGCAILARIAQAVIWIPNGVSIEINKGRSTMGLVNTLRVELT
jgi:hypothetical protein